jgi:hypothetical protein
VPVESCSYLWLCDWVGQSSSCLRIIGAVPLGDFQGELELVVHQQT